MIDFILLFTVFVIGSACMSWVMYSAIQAGEVFGKWQLVLDWLYSRNEIAERFLGGCYKCFSHLWGVFGFILYVLFHEYFLQYHYGWWYLLLYVLFVPTSITTSMIINGVIKKLTNNG